MRSFLKVAALALAALASGCATARAPSGQFEAQYNAPYTLGAGDRLRVIVFGQDALSNS